MGNRISHLRRRIVLIAGLFSSVGAALEAAPELYRFEGTVSWSGWSLQGPLDLAGPYPTQPFSISIEIDLSKGGTVTHPDLTTEFISKMYPAESPYADAFFASFAAGNRLRDTAGELTQLPHHEWALNYGVIMEPLPDSYLGMIGVGGPNWMVVVTGAVDKSLGISGWKVGDVFDVKSSIHTPTGLGSEFYSPATLVSITAVPEPETWALGLVGASLSFMIRRRVCRKK